MAKLHLGALLAPVVRLRHHVHHPTEFKAESQGAAGFCPEEGKPRPGLGLAVLKVSS